MPRPVCLAGLEVVQRHGAADGDHPLAHTIDLQTNTLVQSVAALEVSKTTQVRALLVREAGATLDEIMTLRMRLANCRYVQFS